MIKSIHHEKYEKIIVFTLVICSLSVVFMLVKKTKIRLQNLKQ